MNIRYERQINKSFMVITDIAKISDLEDEMLRENRIRMLLPFFTVDINDETEFWYDITGKQSMTELLEQGAFKTDELTRFLGLLSILFEEFTKYLISPDHLLLTPDTIYFEKGSDGFLPGLCFFPEDDTGIRKRISDIIACFSARDPLVMKLYDCSLRPDFSFDMLLNIIDEDEKPLVQEIFISSSAKEETEEEQDLWFPAEQKDEKEEEGLLSSIKASLRDLLPEGLLSKHSDTEKTDPAKPGKERKKESKREKKRKEKPSKTDKAVENLIIDPFIDISEPTVLLAEGGRVSGKLMYEGSGDEQDHVIKTDVFRIGSRNSDNDAVLHSVGVSRHHAKITREGDEFFISDLNSTNGTYINDELISVNKKIKINPMDRIRFADVSYRFV